MNHYQSSFNPHLLTLLWLNTAQSTPKNWTFFFLAFSFPLSPNSQIFGAKIFPLGLKKKSAPQGLFFQALKFPKTGKKTKPEWDGAAPWGFLSKEAPGLHQNRVKFHLFISFFNGIYLIYFNFYGFYLIYFNFHGVYLVYFCFYGFYLAYFCYYGFYLIYFYFYGFYLIYFDFYGFYFIYFWFYGFYLIYLLLWILFALFLLLFWFFSLPYLGLVLLDEGVIFVSIFQLGQVTIGDLEGQKKNWILRPQSGTNPT